MSSLAVEWRWVFLFPFPCVCFFSLRKTSCFVAQVSVAIDNIGVELDTFEFFIAYFLIQTVGMWIRIDCLMFDLCADFESVYCFYGFFFHSFFRFVHSKPILIRNMSWKILWQIKWANWTKPGTDDKWISKETESDTLTLVKRLVTVLVMVTAVIHNYAVYYLFVNLTGSLSPVNCQSMVDDMQDMNSQKSVALSSYLLRLVCCFDGGQYKCVVVGCLLCSIMIRPTSKGKQGR